MDTPLLEEEKILDMNFIHHISLYFYGQNIQVATKKMSQFLHLQNLPEMINSRQPHQYKNIKLFSDVICILHMHIFIFVVILCQQRKSLSRQILGAF